MAHPYAVCDKNTMAIIRSFVGRLAEHEKHTEHNH
jgi:hypothetical protein